MWSPDGKYFAVVEVAQGVFSSTYTILLRNETTGEVKRLPTPADVTYVSPLHFAPDGNFAATVFYYGDRVEFVIMNIPGGAIEKRFARKRTGSPQTVKWCEQGKLNHVQITPGGGQTVQIDIESGAEKKMPFGSHACAGPGKIAVAGSDHFLLETATGSRKLIAPSARVSALSPDEKVAVYTRSVGDKWHLLRRFTDEGSEEKIAEIEAQQTDGVLFHPDGRRFVVRAKPFPARELWQMNVNFGGAMTRAGK